MTLEDRLKRIIRDVPDFPKPGILFKDITPLLGDPHEFALALDGMEARWRPDGVDAVAAIEARGFILGGALADRLNASFVPLRKPGKLPYESRRVEYSLEYGTDAIEVHVDAFQPGARVLVVDDVLATGGTAAAACKLVRETGAVLWGVGFLVELAFLHGREKLPTTQIHSLLTYA